MSGRTSGRRDRSRSPRTLTVAGAALAVATGVAAEATDVSPAQAGRAAAVPSRHVLLLSVDGMHQSDLSSYVASHPHSALAALVRGGTEYTDARTTFPSDSFPGMVAQATGGGPATTGVFYDDTWNRTLLPGGTVDCRTAPRGAEVSFTEAADRSQNPITLDAGQHLGDGALTALPTNTLAQTLAAAPAITAAILRMTPTPQALLDPAALPVDPATCLPVYPHDYLRVNTVFDVARSHGMRTAWSDKHPAYEILSGPSGTGIQDLFTPEINSVADSAGDDWTKDNLLTQEYDATKVAAVLNEIDGKDHSGARTVGTPAIFGMNFQAVSTAQKLPTSDGLRGGYDASGRPGPVLAKALSFVNAEVGAMVTRIRRDGLAGSTTVLLSAKHGQSPIHPTQLRRVEDGAILDGLNAAWASAHPGSAPLVAFSVDDDGMLLWLSDRRPLTYAFVSHYLRSHSAPANRYADPSGTFSATVRSSGLTKVYAGPAADAFVGARRGNSHVPDIIGLAQQGVVYTGGTKKIAEHGGYHAEDRHVPLLVSGAGAQAGAVRNGAVATKQIAPTILSLLGLDPKALQAVRIEHTPTLR